MPYSMKNSKILSGANIGLENYLIAKMEILTYRKSTLMVEVNT